MAYDDLLPKLRGAGRATARLGLGRRVVGAIMPQLTRGRLSLTLPNGEVVEGEGAEPGSEAAIVFRRWRGLWRLMRGGDIGLAEAFIDGDWMTPDLDALLNLGHENIAAIDAATRGSFLSVQFSRLRHGRNANTRRGSRRNITAHYDLGNQFYECWLDRTMTYSSALYRGETDSLEEAQLAKLARAAELLEVGPGHDVLEIGCGWGAMAENLIGKHGCRVIGLTLSMAQLAYAKLRLAQAPKGAADFRLQDYRDVDGRFDRIVSIEMIEAVGERYWPVYFDKLKAALKPGGVAVVQAITIAEERFQSYRAQPDFIQRHIFPGGMLPTVSIIRAEAARAGLRLVEIEAFGLSYARTLSEWRSRFLAAWPRIESLGFDQRFKRLWLYYLAYCESGFRAGAIDVGLFKLVPAEGPGRPA